MRARRVDHEVDYLLADATVLQIDNLSGRQVIHRLGIADVAENDFVTETCGGQRLYIRHTDRLSLVPALDLSWLLSPWWRWWRISIHSCR